MNELKDKVVVITGASSGIGEEIAYTFAKQGAALGVCGRNKEKLGKVAEQCKAHGAGKVIEIIGDLMKLNDIDQMVEEVVSKLGDVDVLINNCGAIVNGGIETPNVEDFDKIFHVNVRAPFYLTQKCVPHLKKTKGCVVNISTLLTKICETNNLLYSMAKCSIDHFTKSTALELAKYDIRVNSVNPAVVLTPILQQMFSPEKLSEVLGEVGPMHPLGSKCLSTQEIADTVIFLSTSGARCITGTCLLADRGRGVFGK
uniref:Uncharacterized oxidoreductase SERP2049 n=1 Tax=Ciona intestinalis TaxID=7719 RepID=F7BEK9_CIOIN|nr:uncharacterized protein LOC100179397 [Ciona intestinalis]|eukprot:XP_002129412.1 uncharacterized protein LOC100179397 [Ciona intestinalis]